MCVCVCLCAFPVVFCLISVDSALIKLKLDGEIEYTHISNLQKIHNENFHNKNAREQLLPKTDLTAREVICVLLLVLREVIEIVW